MYELQIADSRLAAKIQSQGHCLVEEDLESVVTINRMMPVLVKCNMCRFTTPAQNVKHMVDIIEQHAKFMEEKHGKRAILIEGCDYVRSVEIPVG